jgi:micrococcal nuclease
MARTTPLIPSPVIETPRIITENAPTHQPSATQFDSIHTDISSPSPTDLTSCVPENTSRTTTRVMYVFDGDTIEVNIDGKRYHVRYIGMDAPEDTRTIEYFGAEATEKNKRLVDGRTVTLIKDVSETDKYDRLLRYVLIGNTFVNYQLVVEGYAHAGTYPPDIACDHIFMQAERYARDHQLGLWAIKGTKSP